MGALEFPSKTELLSRVPVFGAFDPEELRALAGLFIEVSYRRGDTICAEGEAGDTFFVCAAGELEVWGGSPRRVINRLGPGEFFGEMSLLVGGRRAATVKASRNARLLALRKPAFERFFLHNAKVLEYLSKVLSQRLATMSRGEAVAQATTTIGVTTASRLKGKTLVATTLARLLQDFSRRDALLLTLHAGDGAASAAARSLSELSDAPIELLRSHLRSQGAEPAILDVAVSPAAEESAAEDLGTVIGKLGEVFQFIVLDPGGQRRALSRAAEEVSDVVVRIVDRFDPDLAAREGAPVRTFQVVNRYNPSSPAVPLNGCEPFVLRADEALRGLAPAAQAAHVRTHPWSPAGPALHRLARKILGATVGLALGGGAAFGLTHLGVLKVLEDNDVPIDLLAGCSFGSLVAIGYAGGIRAAEMLAIAERMGTRWNTLYALMDFTLTRPGLLSGDRLVKLLAPLAGPIQNFEQLALPCRAVAMDIETGERVAIGSGELATAGRASCAIPMVWAPVKIEGRVLVDGGVVEPVPAEVVREMGADVCIAVNAVPRLKKGVQTVLSAWYRRAKRLDPLSYLSGSRDLPNMFDLIMNSMQTLQYELGNFKAISADVRINPDLSALTWIEFYKPREFIERGMEAAERALPAIKRTLAERLEPGRAAAAEPDPGGALAHSGV